MFTRGKHFIVPYRMEQREEGIQVGVLLKFRGIGHGGQFDGLR
jgi:hypothetical protein